MTVPVYLLPGDAGAASDFAFLEPMLGRRRDVRALDRSPGTDGAATAALVADVLGRLPATPVDLVGYGAGAAIALGVAAGSPNIRRLVLVSGRPRDIDAARLVSAPTLFVAASRDAPDDDHALPPHTARVRIDSGPAIAAERPAELLRYIEGFLDGTVLEAMVP